MSAPLRVMLGYTNFAAALPFGVLYPLAGALNGQTGWGGSCRLGSSSPLILLDGVDMLSECVDSELSMRWTSPHTCTAEKLS